MGCGSVLCYILTCGQCGSLVDDSDGEEWDAQEPLLDPLGNASGRGLPAQPRARRPVNTSNMLGLGVRDVNADYELGELLGEGAFGVVRRCRHRRTGQAFACKTVEKAQLRRRADVEDVRREVQILMMLSSHLNVAALLAIYEDASAVHLILELCEGGQLFDEVCARGAALSERDVAHFFRKMVEVVAHCHTLGIAHRDIKPENFLLSRPGPGGEVKAADFGLSQFFRPGRSFKSLVGSAYFVAPEVLKRDYGPAADVWSLGVCAHVLLTGRVPFWGDTEEEIFKMVLHADVDLAAEPWDRVSPRARDCVRRMLTRDPARRPSAAQLLQHAWLCQAAPDAPLGDDVVARIRAFAATTKVRRAAMLMAAQGLETGCPPEISQMMSRLEEEAAAGGGGVTPEAARRAGAALPEDSPEGSRGASAGGDGPAAAPPAASPPARELLSASEVVAATLGSSQERREALVRCLFQRFDPGGAGAVSEDDLFAVLKGFGVSRGEVADVVAAVDADGDGKLNLAEFSSLMARNTASMQEAVRRRWHGMESPHKGRPLGTVSEAGEGEEEGGDEWEE